MTNDIQETRPPAQLGVRPFRRAVLRGLAVLCPPLLTVLIIVWAINTTKSYFLEPVTRWTREGIVWCVADIRRDLAPLPNRPSTAELNGQIYRQVEDDTFIPESVYEVVRRQPGATPPVSGEDYYRRYVDLAYLRPYLTIPFFLAVFILMLYFLGKFMAAGIGRFFVAVFDRSVSRVPGVRAVYSSVKQVSDFLFNERDMTVTRIVAVEFPCKGVWSIGFVTGESMAAIHDAAGEPVLAVFVPYSPLPVTGSMITVRRSECVDLNITFDQACQFIVSCGVAVPPQQLWHSKAEEGPKTEANKKSK
jgi:uncharacterized membrane protein